MESRTGNRQRGQLCRLPKNMRHQLHKPEGASESRAAKQLQVGGALGRQLYRDRPSPSHAGAPNPGLLVEHA